MSSLLNPASVRIIGSSHNNSIFTKNGIIYFRFSNIHLPDSNSDKIKSDGIIHFQVLPQSTIKVGSSLSNEASIYFDYNVPDVTNTAITAISNKITLPISLNRYQVKVLNTSKTAIENYWTTATETSAAYFNVQRSINGIDFITIGKVTAKGIGLNPFIDNGLALQTNQMVYYRLQMADKNGSYTYSKIVQLAIDNRQLTVFPNPIGNVLKLQIATKKTEIVTLQIIGLLGSVLQQQTTRLSVGTNNISLPVTSFAKGNYRVVIKGAVLMQKGFVKE